MKNLNQRKKILGIVCFAFILVFAFTQIAASGIQDDELQQNTNIEDAQVDDSQKTKVVSVSQDDAVVNGSEQPQEQTSLSPIENATAVASSYIELGKTKDEILLILTTDMGYTQTEAEIAYSKADVSASSTLDTQAETETTEVEQTLTVSAKDRVSEGVEQKPGTKFKHIRTKTSVGGKENTFWNIRKRNVTENEKTTVTEMLDEGYSIEDIAKGFSENRYSSTDIACIFKETGVSADDTYKAISTIDIEKAETKAEDEKPRAKFKKTTAQDNKNKAKQGAVLGVLNSMKEAGYDTQQGLDDAVQDLKDTGMSSAQVYDALIEKVADGKPRGKFRRKNYNRKPKMESYGDGEVALAAAMLKAGYDKADIQAAFKNVNESGSYNRYSYEDETIQKIMLSVETQITQEQNLTITSTNTTINKETEKDILKRNTQANPI